MNLFVKIEAFNPLVGQGPAGAWVIEDAERPAAEARADRHRSDERQYRHWPRDGVRTKGYPLVVTMAETFSVERRKLMRFLGAKVVLTPAAERGMGMVKKAVELAETHGWFLTRQFENEANADMHSRTTARRSSPISQASRWIIGSPVRHRRHSERRRAVLAKERPETKIVVCEPADAPMLTSGAPQQRQPDGSAAAAHPSWKPHPMQGWSPDFIPKLTGDAVAMQVIDRVVTVSNADAMQCSRELAQKEGIFVGITAGATFAGALQVCRDATKGATVLCMLPDTGSVSEHTALCGRSSRDDRGRDANLAVDAECALGRLGWLPDRLLGCSWGWTPARVCANHYGLERPSIGRPTCNGKGSDHGL